MKGSHGENMNILKKGSTALLLFVLLLMALPVFGASPENSAQTVDPAVPGKILIRYRAGADGTKPVAGASFTVYRIAETGSFGKMTGLSFGPDGKRFTVDEKTDPRRIEAAVREAYRGSVDGGFTRTQTTGREGDAVFSDLPHGVYLVSETASAEGYRPSSAFLVTIPWSGVEKDADGGESWCWHYEAEAYPKAEPVPVYPETGDESSLLLYGFLAGASALMLILILRGRKMHGKRKKPGVLTALALCMALLAGCLAGPAAVFAGTAQDGTAAEMTEDDAAADRSTPSEEGGAAAGDGGAEDGGNAAEGDGGAEDTDAEATGAETSPAGTEKDASSEAGAAEDTESVSEAEDTAPEGEDAAEKEAGGDVWIAQDPRIVDGMVGMDALPGATRGLHTETIVEGPMTYPYGAASPHLTTTGGTLVYCILPWSKAPGGKTVSFNSYEIASSTAGNLQLLAKLMYYGYGGAGNILTGTADEQMAVTHFALSRVWMVDMGNNHGESRWYWTGYTTLGAAGQAAVGAFLAQVKDLEPVKGTLYVAEYYNASGHKYQDLAYGSFATEPKGTGVKLKKVSACPAVSAGNRMYSLAGAEFALYTDEACTQSAKGAETGTDVLFRTDETGDTEEVKVLPGDYWIKETAAPAGFTSAPVKKITVPQQEETFTAEIADMPKNDPLTVLLRKVDEETGRPSDTLAGAEYTVCYYDVSMDTDPADSGEGPLFTWVFATDENGVIQFGEAWKKGGDPFVTDPGTGAAVLPLGTITIRETKAPEGYLLNDTVYVANTVSEVGGLVRTENLPDGETGAPAAERQIPVIGTTASVSPGGGSAVLPSEETVVTDRIAYAHFEPGKELTAKGTLRDAGTGEVLAADGAAAEMTFTAEEYSGIVDMTFTFDSTQLAGTDVVVFEEIYDGDTLIASHCDLADSAQTVHILSETVKPHKTVDKVSSAVGETRVWTVHCGVPADFHDGEGSLYMIRDVIDPEREEVAGKRLDYTGGLTLSLDGEALDPETDCAIEEPSEDNGMCLTVTFLPEGLTKLAQRASQPGNEDCIVLTYETVINENALAAEKIPNEAEVSFGRYGIVVTETTERPDVYTGEIRIRKMDEAGGGPLSGVVFALLDEDMQPVEKDGAAWIETTDEGGSAVFFGVADGVYYLRELRTVNGKMLLTGEVRVTVEEGKTEETELTVRNSAAVPLSAGGMGDGILYCLAAALSLLSLRLRRKEGRSHG
ncbi:MAG: VaFE repeat-containing surface-anchored protein [Lachnospiraceae bacterium]|nr:VaFE repeat-containing surface-anchored protein [Lachnospiraceae bacterium]